MPFYTIDCTGLRIPKQQIVEHFTTGDGHAVFETTTQAWLRLCPALARRNLFANNVRARSQVVEPEPADFTGQVEQTVAVDIDGMGSLSGNRLPIDVACRFQYSQPVALQQCH